MDSLDEIKQEINKYFKCRYHQSKRFVHCVESNGIGLFITNDINEIEQMIGYAQHVRLYTPHVKFEFYTFLQIIKNRPITNNQMVSYYKDYIIIYQHQYRIRTYAKSY